MSLLNFYMNFHILIRYYFLVLILFGILSLFNKYLLSTGFLIYQERDFFVDKSLLDFLKVILLICLLTPIIEEFSFRYWLNMKSYSVRIGFSFFFITMIMFLTNHILKINIFLNFFINIIAPFVLVGFIKYRFVDEFIDKLKISNFYLIILSAIVFALFHLNLNYIGVNIFFSLIALTPFFSFGVICGILRLKHGFKYSLILHFTINFTGILIMYFD